ncbi:phage shock protein PspC (stress-responsive transcriptional regulator) [Pedobacter cryoconitis]|uniref:Phage shock protein PspC (Stress-responsive transcriptional regulator) n=1 Tax=Pedobacter cryoconitis TaxID=188932 RepID=A0A7W8ZKY2_9SPHI|nr:PspC domain-containing protein [Pedobacter cryoconitis]MBB5635913.1 phage shock protein PspC (stress-responsive transcriptional regulator) [Pedobacter cryoconitis]
MKKTLNINIGNSIIHIEEGAYELLTSYLIEVKQHFGKSADDFEIVSDIENRIAEMFTEILHTQQKQVIELEDVQVVIGLMGSVKDFEEGAEEEPATDFNSPYTTAFAERKIYRDTDEAMVAGVCSGLSHYLKMDVSILRIVTVLSIFLGGSGLIAYLVLWIAIPKASTRAEKMAMKGEAANLQGFKRSFEEELSNLKDNLKNANEHLQPLVKQSGNFITEFITVLGTFLQGSGKIIFKFIAIILMITGSVLLLGDFISLAAILGVWYSGVTQIFPLNIINGSYLTFFSTAVFFVIGIPLLGVILLSVRVAFNTRPIHQMVSYGLLLSWLCALSVGIFFVAKVGSEFKEEATFAQTLSLQVHPVYTLEIDKSMFFSKEDSLRLQLNSTAYAGKIIQKDPERSTSAPRNVTIRIEKSDNNIPSVTESYSSKGKDFASALNQAKNIRYDFIQKDSLLKFSPEVHLQKNAYWRDQHVELLIKLPVGTKLRINKNLDRYLNGYSLWDCDDENFVDDRYEGVMTGEGLKCQIEKK